MKDLNSTGRKRQVNVSSTPLRRPVAKVLPFSGKEMSEQDEDSFPPETVIRGVRLNRQFLLRMNHRFKIENKKV